MLKLPLYHSIQHTSTRLCMSVKNFEGTMEFSEVE